MKFAIPVLALAVATVVPVSAQDSTATTRTKTKDDTRTVMMTGCVREDPVKHTYSLVGTMVPAVDPSKPKTNVEKGAVGTSGSTTTYSLLSPAEVELSTYVGRRVDLSVIKTQTDDSIERSKATSDLRDAEYTVVSVKPIAGTCSAN